MKRLLLGVLLVSFSVFCFWFALSGPDTPPKDNGGRALTTPREGNNAGTATAVSGGLGARDGTAQAGGAANDAGGLAAGSASTGSRTISAPGSPTNPAPTSSALTQLACQANCRTLSTTCQSGCYRQYNVSNETQYWAQCVQTCGTQLSVCVNGCGNGTATAAPLTPKVPPPASKPSSSQPPAAKSMPTPPLSPQSSGQQ